jgi:hypothetical protein
MQADNGVTVHSYNFESSYNISIKNICRLFPTALLKIMGRGRVELVLPSQNHRTIEHVTMEEVNGVHLVAKRNP